MRILALHSAYHRIALRILALYSAYPVIALRILALYSAYPRIALPGINLMHSEKLQLSVYFAHPPTFTFAIAHVHCSYIL